MDTVRSQYGNELQEGLAHIRRMSDECDGLMKGAMLDAKFAAIEESEPIKKMERAVKKATQMVKSLGIKSEEIIKMIEGSKKAYENERQVFTNKIDDYIKRLEDELKKPEGVKKADEISSLINKLRDAKEDTSLSIAYTGVRTSYRYFEKTKASCDVLMNTNPVDLGASFQKMGELKFDKMVIGAGDSLKATANTLMNAISEVQAEQLKLQSKVCLPAMAQADRILPAQEQEVKAASAAIQAVSPSKPEVKLAAAESAAVPAAIDKEKKAAARAILAAAREKEIQKPVAKAPKGGIPTPALMATLGVQAALQAQKMKQEQAKKANMQQQQEQITRPTPTVGKIR